jgi:hypothetical protein
MPCFKKKWLLFFILFIPTVGFSQLSNSYTLSLNKYQNCTISFFNTGYYFIEIDEFESSDNILSLILSQGYYKLRRNEITLNDQFYHVNMKLSLDNDKLVVEQSYRFLNNKEFRFHMDSPKSEPLHLKENTDSVQLSIQRTEFNKINRSLNPLDYGRYTYDPYFILYLESDNKYRFVYRRTLISEGTWNRDQNILELHDTSIHNTFYLLISQKGLISKYLPGDDVSVTLTNRK